MSPRPDLAALDEQALIMLANRGLYKRALKEVQSGKGPKTEVLEDGTLVGTSGETTTTFRPGDAFKQSACSCGASRACRHRVATILAFQAETSPAHQTPLPPLDLHEERLKTRLGAAVLQAAQRKRERGYSATVRFSHPPTVLLPACTVTFLVPWELSHVQCDCVASLDCEHVALAAWALMASPSQGGEHLVAIRNAPCSKKGQPAIDAFLELTHDLVRSGWAGSLKGVDMRLAQLTSMLKKERLVWLEDLLESLVTALRESALGLTGADPLLCSHLLTEVMMRAKATPSDRVPRGYLYGEETTGTTKLDHVVLRGLGARYRVYGQTGRLSLFFCEANHDDALVMERQWTVDKNTAVPTGPAVGKRRLVGTTTEVLATSNITTQGATRRANRVIDVRRNRMQTAVMRGSGTHVHTYTDYTALREKLSKRVPEMLSPRVRAWRVVAVSIHEVETAGYDPGSRTVWGILVDEHGGRALVTSEWRPEAPAGPALLARALREGAENLSAEAYLRRGQLWLEPLSITFEGVPVPVDLHEDIEMPALDLAEVPQPGDALATSLAQTRAWLGDAARRGVSHLTGAQLAQGHTETQRLHEAGFYQLAATLQDILSDGDRVAAWGRATTRLELLTHALARVTHVNP